MAAGGPANLAVLKPVVVSCAAPADVDLTAIGAKGSGALVSSRKPRIQSVALLGGARTTARLSSRMTSSQEPIWSASRTVGTMPSEATEGGVHFRDQFLERVLLAAECASRVAPEP